MNFEWLAALAYPRSVAVHPNFSSGAMRTAPAKLAAEILEESHFHSLNGAAEQAAAEGEAFADVCIAALRDPSDEALEALELEVLDESADLGQRACAALILVSIQLESGLPRRDILQPLVRSLAPLSDPATRLTYCWLRLGSIAIAAAYGEDVAEQVRSVREALDQFEIDQPIEFRTTVGLQLSAAIVFDRVLEFLSHSALEWEVRLEQLGGDVWMQGLRRPMPVILAGLQSRMASGYEEWAKGDFQERFRRQTTVIGGSPLPGDDNMLTSVLVAQFCFHPYAHHAALDLGRARFVRGQDLDTVELRAWSAQSALALLRFSGHRETVQGSVRYTLKNGPLAALTADIIDVLRAVELRGALAHLEVQYLQEVATLLSKSQADRLFEMASEELRGVRPAFRDRWVAAWSRREDLAKLAGRVSDSGGRQASLSELLVHLMNAEVSEPQDRIIAAAFRAASNIDLSDSHAVLVRLAETPDQFPVLRASMAAKLSEAAVSEFVAPAPGEDALGKAIVHINALITDPGLKADVSETAKHGQEIRNTLGAIKNSIGVSGQNIGGIEPIDVAVAYATVGGLTDLWRPIIELLTEPRVHRGQKSAALRRVVKSASAVPAPVRQLLADGLPGLLLSERSLFDDGPTPYPEGLAAAAALDLISQAELMASVGPWISSPKVSSRLNAVKVLGAVPGRSMPVWISQALLLMTFDNDADVQADAMQALASVYREAGATQPAILDRANDLLARDGTWLLRKVLAELKSDASAPLREGLRGRIAGLSRHVDLRVRRAATEVLELELR